MHRKKKKILMNKTNKERNKEEFKLRSSKAVLTFSHNLFIYIYIYSICSTYSLRNLNKHIEKKHKDNQDKSYLKTVQIFMNQCSVDFVK